MAYQKRSTMRRPEQYDGDAKAILAAAPSQALDAANRFFRAHLGTSVLFTTMVEADRVSRATNSDQEDLKTLDSVLAPGTLATDPTWCDQTGLEPSALTFIRQVEGKAPLGLGALLLPDYNDAAEEAVTEATALGFGINQGQRRLALIGPAQATHLATGEVEIGTGTRWSDLSFTAKNNGLWDYSGVQDLAPSPLAAVDIGLIPATKTTSRFGGPWSALIELPPKGTDVTQRLWTFDDKEKAEEVWSKTLRQFRPAVAE